MIPKRQDQAVPWVARALPARVAVRAELIREEVLRPLCVELPAAEADLLRQDRQGWSSLLERLLRDIDTVSARQLLRDDHPSHPLPPGPARDEASLDAAAPDRTDTRFERACFAGCRALAAASLSRLPLGEPVRTRLLALLPAAPAATRAGETVLVDAILLGQPDRLSRLLSQDTGVSEDAICNALATRNRRGLVALAWKAGASMHTAWLLQVVGAGVEPDRAIGPSPDGACPLGRAEMAWQIDFMGRASSG